MKHFQIIFQVVLAVAVAVLYYLHFNSSSKSIENEANSENQAPVEFSLSKSGNIIYLNTDSLFKNYEFVQNELSALEKEKNRLEGQLEGKMRVLEQEVYEFQARVQKGLFANEDEARKREAELMEKQQNLAELKEKLATELYELEAKKNKAIRDEIEAFMKEYRKGKTLDFVLGYTTGGGIWFANDSLDATNEIVSGLNAQYKNKSKATTAK